MAGSEQQGRDAEGDGGLAVTQPLLEPLEAEEALPQKRVLPPDGKALGRLLRTIVFLNALDPKLVRSRHEVVYPAILLGLVILNGGVAFGSFALASEVFFPGSAMRQRVAAGALMGLIVGFVDWMIIAWHPFLPPWFESGRPTSGVQVARSLLVVLPAAGLTTFGLWALAPQYGLGVRLFWGALAGALVVVAYVWCERRRLARIQAEVDGQGYPTMPDFVERLVPFVVRMLLTAVLSVVIGTGLSVVINRDAVELARKDLAWEGAVTQVRADWESQNRTVREEYEAAKRLWEVEDRRLVEDVVTAQTAVEKADGVLKQAGERVRCERGDQVPGFGECTGVAGDRGHTVAVEEEAKARQALEDARATLETANNAKKDHQGSNPPEPVLPDEPGEPSDEQVEAQLAGLQGLSGTLRSLEHAAAGWSWPVRWGPEIVIFVVDMIPVLLKLLLGYQDLERRMWRREAEDVSDDLSSRRVTGAARSAAIQAAEERKRGIVAVAGVKADSSIAVAEVRKKADVELASLRAAADRDIAELENAERVKQAQRRIEDAPSQQAPNAQLEEPRDSELPPFVDEGDMKTGPAPAQQEVFRFGDQNYVRGPLLSGNGESANDVYLAVRCPESSDYPINNVFELVRRCVVVKTKGGGVPNHLWAQVLNAYRDSWSAEFEAGAYRSMGDVLVNGDYYPRGDLVRYLGEMGDEGRDLNLREVVTWGAQLANSVYRLHSRGWIHNDIKPANILVTGEVEVPGSRLVDPIYGQLVLTDFDNSHPMSETRNVWLTPAYAAPECLDRSHHRYCHGSPAADVFGVGAVLLYVLTGEAVNDLVQMQPSTTGKPPGDGWQHAYAAAIPGVLDSAMKQVPISQEFKQLLSDMLNPYLDGRPDILAVKNRLDHIFTEVDPGQSIPLAERKSVLRPQGISKDLVAHFEGLGYKVNL